MTITKSKILTLLVLVLALLVLAVSVTELTDGEITARASETHSHIICGATTTCTHSLCGNKELRDYTALTQETVEGWTLSNGLYEIPKGNYVLTENITLSSTGLISSTEVALCLNGYTLTCTTITNASALMSVCDCSSEGNGKIVVTTATGLRNADAFTLFSGIIESTVVNPDNPYGGSRYGTIYSQGTASKNATLTVYGGEVKAVDPIVYPIFAYYTTLTVHGGTFTSSSSLAVYLYIASGEIFGGTLKSGTESSSSLLVGYESTAQIRGGSFEGVISVDNTASLEILDDKTIPNTGIKLSRIGQLNNSDKFHLDLSGYTGNTQFTVKTTASVFQGKWLARGDIKHFKLDETAHPDWEVIQVPSYTTAQLQLRPIVMINHVAHFGGEGTATCQKGNVCEECEQTYGDVNPDNHVETDVAYRRNEDGTHDVVHSCCLGIIEESVECSLNPDNVIYYCDREKKCYYCSYVLEPPSEHVYGEYEANASYHYRTCTVERCGYSYSEEHVFTDENDDYCNVCDAQKAVSYHISIGETEVTSLNADDVLGDLDVGATVTYNPKTNVLTLNDANVSVNWYIGIEAYDYVNDRAGNLNLHLIGTNTVSVYGYTESYGIYAGSLKISADNGGTLAITVDDGIDEAQLTLGIAAEIIYVESGKVTVSGEYMAVSAGSIVASAKGSAEFNATTLSNAVVSSSGSGATALVNDVIAKTAELTPTYNLTVGGVTVTNENASDVFNDASSNGNVPTASYDALTNTLTLTNAEITTENGFPAIMTYATAIDDFYLNLNIHLVGENVISVSSSDDIACGITANDLRITAAEGASLAINANTEAYEVYCIYLNGSLYVEGGEISLTAVTTYVDGVAFGVCLEAGSLYVNADEINIISTADAGYAYGVLLAGPLYVNGGEMNISATIALHSSGAIEAEKHVFVGSLTSNADPEDLVLAPLSLFEGVYSAFIGTPDYDTVCRTLRIYPHVHSWTAVWTTDENVHYHECTALSCYITDNSLKDGYSTHSPLNDDGNCLTAEYCVCGEVAVDVSSHAFDNDCDTSCNKCSFTREITHTPNEDDGDCGTAVTCSICGVVTTIAKPSHAFNNACDVDCNNVGCAFTRVTTHVPNADDGNCTTDVLCSICGEVTTVGNLSHAFSASYLAVNADQNKHYHICTNVACSQKDGGEAHAPNVSEATEEVAKYCTVCNLVLEAQLGHTHHFNETVNEHYMLTPANCTERAVYYKSCVCGQMNAETFVAGELDGSKHTGTATVIVANANGTHDVKYACCGAVASASVACTGGTATCSSKAVCSVCNTEYGEKDALNHVKNTFILVDNGETHAKKYECCGSVMVSAESHAYGDDGKCACGHEELRSEPVIPNVPSNSGGEDSVATPVEPEKEGLSGGTIAGIAVGSSAVVGISVFAIIWFVVKKKKL